MKQEQEEKTSFEKLIAGLKLRGIGPAVMGGRIIDIAVHPTRHRQLGMWRPAQVVCGRRGNAGTTWKAMFEDQPSYSIGCVTIDPINPEVDRMGWNGRKCQWTSRRLGGRGLSEPRNGGASWKQMAGLESSEHIGKILVDPRDESNGGLCRGSEGSIMVGRGRTRCL